MFSALSNQFLVETRPGQRGRATTHVHNTDDRPNTPRFYSLTAAGVPFCEPTAHGYFMYKNSPTSSGWRFTERCLAGRRLAGWRFAGRSVARHRFTGPRFAYYSL